MKKPCEYEINCIFHASMSQIHASIVTCFSCEYVKWVAMRVCICHVMRVWINFYASIVWYIPCEYESNFLCKYDKCGYASMSSLNAMRVLPENMIHASMGYILSMRVLYVICHASFEWILAMRVCFSYCSMRVCTILYTMRVCYADFSMRVSDYVWHASMVLLIM